MKPNCVTTDDITRSAVPSPTNKALTQDCAQ